MILRPACPLNRQPFTHYGDGARGNGGQPFTLVRHARLCHGADMSAKELVAELSNLNRPELEEVDARLHELLGDNRGTVSKSWGEALLELAGSAQGLPDDLAHNHDHYLHGAARR